MLLPILLMLAAAPEDPGKCGIDDGVQWFQDADFPAEARARGEQGVVVYRLEVDAEGCATACEIIRGSGVPALDALTCPLLMQRARFSPALSLEGQPVASSYRGARWWMIPEPPPPGITPPEPRQPMASWLSNDDYPVVALRDRQQGSVGFRLQVDETGRVTGCTLWLNSGVPALDEATCSLLMRRARLNPARNAAGEAVPGVFSNGMLWVLPQD